MKTRSKKVSVLFREGISKSHHKGVNRLLSYNGSIISAGRDGIIREYNTESLDLIHAYDRHIH